jgi:hypothetical protein
MLDRPAPRDAKPPSSALRRARNRRHRERVRAGKLTVTVEIDELGIAWLIANNYLTERDASDPRTVRARVGEAVAMLLRLSSR